MALAILLGATVPPAAAQYAWTGQGIGPPFFDPVDWSIPFNWQNNSPAVSGANTTIAFNVPASGVSSNNIGNPFVLNSLTFNVGMTVAGLPFDFRTSGSAVLPQIVQNSPNAVSLVNDLILTNNLTVTGTGAGGVTLSGLLSGSGSLTVSGVTATVSGASTYSGGTNIFGLGILKLGASGSLPSAGAVTIGSGTLSLNGFNQTIGGLTLGAALANPTVTTGAGTLTLGGDILFNGGGNTQAGLLSGQINLGGATRTVNITTISSQSYDVVISAAIAGSGGLTQAGNTSGFLVLNSANSYTGPTTVTAGLLYTGAAGALPATTDATVAAGAVLNLSPTVSALGVTAGNYNQSISSLSGAGFVNLGAATLTLNQTANTTFSGAIAGGSLVMNSDGLLTLTNVNNSVNLIIQNGGLIAVDTATGGPSGFGALGSGSLALNLGGALMYTGPTAACSKNITLGTFGGIVVQANGTNLTLNGVISESAAASQFIVNGPGTTTLAASNTYTGSTVVQNNATLAVSTITNGGVPSPVGSSSSDPTHLQLGNAGDRATLLLTGTNPAYSTDRGVSVGGNPYFIDGTGGVIAVQNAGTTLTINGQITGNSTSITGSKVGILVKAGAGRLVLTNATNNYAGSYYSGGTSVEAGTLVVGASGPVIPAGSPVTVSAGATLEIGPSAYNYSAPIGTLTLNGGTLRVPSGGPAFYISQLATDVTGGSINLTGSTGIIWFSGTNTLAIVKGNSSWTGTASQTIATSGTTAIDIAANVTLNSNVPLGAAGGAEFRLTGAGTYYCTAPPNNYITPLMVNQGRIRLDDLSVDSSGRTPLGFEGFLTLDGGGLLYPGSSQTTPFPILLGPAGGMVEVGNAGTTLTLTGSIGGNPGTPTGPLIKAGPGTLVLANTSNAYAGGITVNAGRLDVTSDAQLGLAAVTVNPAGILRYTANSSTARTFNLAGGVLEAAAGVTVTYAGATISGGYLRGAGTHNLADGTAVYGTSTLNSTTVSVTGAAALTNFSNSGALTVAAALPVAPTFAGFINQGSGAITVGAGSQVLAADFQSYGTLTLNPGSGAGTTQFNNIGTSPLFFNGGSRTFISVPSHAGQFDAGIDLAGQNAVVAGGLFVNNGYVVDSVGAGTKTVVADFGSLVKGAGFFQNSVQTVNGGKFQSGNSPGRSSFGSFTFGPGGVSNYVFAIDDATGTAGPSPDASGQVSGWGLVNVTGGTPVPPNRLGGTGVPPVSGDFAWTADTTHPVTVHLDTLINPTTVGTDVAGPMADFDPTRGYSWPAVQWAGNYSGPADAAALAAATAFDTGGFANPIAGNFGWSLDAADHTLSLTYSPGVVPEPGTLALLGAASLAFGAREFKRRRRAQ